MASSMGLFLGLALIASVTVVLASGNSNDFEKNSLDETPEVPANPIPFKERIRHIKTRLEQLKTGIKNRNESTHHHHHHHHNTSENHLNKGKQKLSEKELTETPQGDQPITEKLIGKSSKKLTRSASPSEMDRKQIGPLVISGLGQETRAVETRNAAGELVYVIPERTYSIQINGADLMASSKNSKDENVEFNIVAGPDGNSKVNVDLRKSPTLRDRGFLDLGGELEPIVLYRFNPSPRESRYARPYPLQSVPSSNGLMETPNFYPFPAQNPFLPQAL